MRAGILHLRVSSPLRRLRYPFISFPTPLATCQTSAKATERASCERKAPTEVLSHFSCRASGDTTRSSAMARNAMYYIWRTRSSLKSRAASRPLPGCGLVLRCLKFEGRISCNRNSSSKLFGAYTSRPRCVSRASTSHYLDIGGQRSSLRNLGYSLKALQHSIEK